jgi:hypothetical protein
MLDLILLSYQRGFWKSSLATFDIHIVCRIPYTWLSKYDSVSYSLHMIVQIWQKVVP